MGHLALRPAALGSLAIVPRKGNHTECLVCGEPPEVCGPLSTRGLCVADAKARMHANNDQLKAHRGPFFERWRVRGIASYGGIVPALDSPSGDGQTR